MQRQIQYHDFGRIKASGTTRTEVCNLYFTNEEVPYAMKTEWVTPWQTTSNNVQMELFTRFSIWEDWRSIYKIKGQNETSHQHVEVTSRMLRIRVENVDNHNITFEFTVSPVHGSPVDMEPWVLSLIILGVCLFFTILVFVAIMIFRRLKK